MIGRELAASAYDSNKAQYKGLYPAGAAIEAMAAADDDHSYERWYVDAELGN